MQYIKLIDISQQKKVIILYFLKKKELFHMRKANAVTFGTNFWIAIVLALYIFNLQIIFSHERTYK